MTVLNARLGWLSIRQRRHEKGQTMRRKARFQFGSLSELKVSGKSLELSKMESRG